METIEHLFFHCAKVSMFWDDLKVLLNSLNITIKLDIKNVLFSAECTIGMVWGLTALKHYGTKV